MNIAFIGNFYEDAVNGVSVSTYITAAELKKLGHRVFFYDINASSEPAVAEDHNGIVIRKFKNRYFASDGKLSKHLQDNVDDIDIFHLSSVFIPFNYAVAMKLKAAGLPYLLSPHGGYNINIFKRKALLKKFYTSFFEKKIITNASGIHCIAEKEVDDVRRLGYNGPVRIIGNPVKTYRASATPAPPQTDGHCQVLYLGRYDIEHKGLDYLLNLQKEIEKRTDKVRLKLFGRGKDKEALLNLKEKLALRQTEINDPIYNEAKEREIAASHLYVQSSRWEGFGISIVEAMYRGLPVAVSKGCYISDFIRNKDAGIILSENLSESAEGVIRLLTEKERYADISGRARKTATEEFAPRKIALKFQDFYNELIRQ